MKGTSILLVDGKAVGFAEVEMEQAISHPAQHYTPLVCGSRYSASGMVLLHPWSKQDLEYVFGPVELPAPTVDLTINYQLDPGGWMPVFDMDGATIVRVLKGGNIQVVKQGFNLGLTADHITLTR